MKMPWPRFLTTCTFLALAALRATAQTTAPELAAVDPTMFISSGVWMSGNPPAQAGLPRDWRLVSVVATPPHPDASKANWQTVLLLWFQDGNGAVHVVKGYHDGTKLVVERNTQMILPHKR